MDTWSRKDVTSCTCTALSYVHIHCPCQKCKLKAVSRSVEYRHWQDATLRLSVYHTDLADSSGTNISNISGKL